MAKWVRNPPSPQRVRLVFMVVALCLIVIGVEKLIGWPAWMTVNPNIKPKF
ncbi:hypothetical protein [Cypionkella sp.]|uniref:hypothetical protein n=1 Tax=Cypionkella sp. TaxID=2811411 RepID=UPI0037504315